MKKRVVPEVKSVGRTLEKRLNVFFFVFDSDNKNIPSRINCRTSCISSTTGETLVERFDEAFTTYKIQCIWSFGVGFFLINGSFFLNSEAFFVIYNNTFFYERGIEFIKMKRETVFVHLHIFFSDSGQVYIQGIQKRCFNRK